MAQSGGHAGHSHGEENMSDGRLVWAVALNGLLTKLTEHIFLKAA